MNINIILFFSHDFNLFLIAFSSLPFAPFLQTCCNKRHNHEKRLATVKKTMWKLLGLQSSSLIQIWSTRDIMDLQQSIFIPSKSLLLLLGKFMPLKLECNSELDLSKIATAIWKNLNKVSSYLVKNLISSCWQIYATRNLITANTNLCDAELDLSGSWRASWKNILCKT